MAADPHSLVAPYALHALDDDEGRSFEEHLAVCERCREELAGLREAAASLAYGVAGPAPPPELKERILAQARSERENVASLPVRRRRSWTAPLAAAAAVAAAVAIGLGFWTATRPSEGSALAKVLGQPGANLVPMGDNGAVAVAPNGEAAIALRVPTAPSGKTYEAWVIRNGKATPAGLFRGSDGASDVEVERSVPRGSVVAVTIERSGGVNQPTQKPLAATEAIS
jgi:anti-sigma-K factor RskA